MTASQQPDAEHAPLTSPAAAGSGSTGHDKAVEAVMAVHWTAARHGQLCPVWTMSRSKRKPGPLDQCNCWVKPQSEDILSTVLAALRAALAAGDADVAEALGLREQCIPWECSCSGVGYVHHDDGQPHQATTTKRRFATEWREVSGER